MKGIFLGSTPAAAITCK